MTTIIDLDGTGHKEQTMSKIQAVNYIKARLSKGRFIVLDYDTGQSIPYNATFQLTEAQKIALIPQVAGG